MYDTVSANDVNDLLNKLRLFLISAGWTVDFWGDRTDLSGKVLSVHKNTQYFSWCSKVGGGSASNPADAIGTMQHDAWASNANPLAQANPSAICYTNGLVGPFKECSFFEGEESGFGYVYVVVEVTTGFFKHFHLGELVRDQAVTTGRFCTGSSWLYGSSVSTSDPNSHFHAYPFDDGCFSGYLGFGLQVRADSDGISPRWCSSNSSSTNYARCGFTNVSPDSKGTITAFSSWGPSTETGRAPLIPLEVGISRGAGYYSYLGHAPDVRYVNISDFDPGEVLPIGSDEWVLFPAHRKLLSSEGVPYSGQYGYAYRKRV